MSRHITLAFINRHAHIRIEMILSNDFIENCRLPSPPVVVARQRHGSAALLRTLRAVAWSPGSVAARQKV